MAEKKYTKEGETKRLLEVLNSSEDHKGLFSILLEEHKQIHSGDFNPDYLEKEDRSLQTYIKALDEVIFNYKYDPKLKKYVKKVDPSGGIGMRNPTKKNKGGMIDYRKKGLFK